MGKAPRRNFLLCLALVSALLLVMGAGVRAVERDKEALVDLAAILAASLKDRDQPIFPGVTYRLAEVGDYGLSIHAWAFDKDRYSLRTAAAASPRGEPIADFLGKPGDVFAINGGFFEKDKAERLTASGLLVVDGSEMAPVNPRAGSGLLYTDANGVHIRYRKNAPSLSATTSALQAGPILVEPGGRMGMKGRKGDERHNRSAICLRENAIVAVVVEGGLHLFDLAELLAAPRLKGGFGCDIAINLDGASSTQAIFRGGGKNIRVPGETPVQNALVISARK